MKNRSDRGFVSSGHAEPTASPNTLGTRVCSPPTTTLKRGLLMRSELFLLPEDDVLAWCEPGPIDDAVFEGRKIDLRNGWLLVPECVVRMLRPEVRRRDDDPARDATFSRKRRTVRL